MEHFSFPTLVLGASTAVFGCLGMFGLAGGWAGVTFLGAILGIAWIFLMIAELIHGKDE